MWIRFFVEFRHFLVFFFGYFIKFLVVFSLYLAITMKKSKRLKRRKRKNIIICDKSGKRRGSVGGGSPNVDKKFLSVNIINFG